MISRALKFHFISVFRTAQFYQKCFGVFLTVSRFCDSVKASEEAGERSTEEKSETCAGSVARKCILGDWAVTGVYCQPESWAGGGYWGSHTWEDWGMPRNAQVAAVKAVADDEKASSSARKTSSAAQIRRKTVEARAAMGGNQALGSQYETIIW